MLDDPVILPPGRLRLATNPWRTGSRRSKIRLEYRRQFLLDARREQHGLLFRTARSPKRAAVQDPPSVLAIVRAPPLQIDIRYGHSDHRRNLPLSSRVGIPDIRPLHIHRRIEDAHHWHHWHRRLLRARRDRPRRRAAEHTEKFAPPHIRSPYGPREFIVAAQTDPSIVAETGFATAT